jgi:hypothetical protein
VPEDEPEAPPGSLYLNTKVHGAMPQCMRNLYQHFSEYLESLEKVKQSHYRPEVPRGFQEVKVPKLHDNAAL